jgi:hypothetical protein
MPPYQVRGRLIKSGMTERVSLIAGLIIIENAGRMEFQALASMAAFASHLTDALPLLPGPHHVLLFVILEIFEDQALNQKSKEDMNSNRRSKVVI